MRRVFQFTALVVLALWLPTTVHCNLEACLGWHTESCCSEHGGDADAPVDHCAVEGGGYRISDASVIVAAPDALLSWCDHAPDVVQVAEAPAKAPEFSEFPHELARTWQFVERAAWPARAPSRVS